MKCPKCGNEKCQIVNEMSTSGKSFDAASGCCGAILFGPLGLLCGACGQGKQMKSSNYWLCNECGNKWKS